MAAPDATAVNSFVHWNLPGGVEFAADLLPDRDTVALVFRVLVGVADDPPGLAGLNHIVERTLSKGTASYTGQQLADAFDRLGAQWMTVSGRQSTIVRVLCLPEFALEIVDLVGEMLCRPTFPADACDVAVQLAVEDRKHMEDEPYDLLRELMGRLTLGPTYGRHVGGELTTLPLITRDAIEAHWKRYYGAGRLQVAAAGPLNADAFRERLERAFGGWGDPTPLGREPVAHRFEPAREHRHKDSKQEYIGIALPGAPREHADFRAEQVLVGVLSGGMSGRLFVEVREKQGLVYWVGAWHEQPRGLGLLHLGASTTPERCDQTFRTLLREIERLSEDLEEDEVVRARDSLIAHYETEDDLTRARATSLSDDLFHYGRPIGLQHKLEAIRGVTLAAVADYARRLPRGELCVGTLGPLALGA